MLTNLPMPNPLHRLWFKLIGAFTLVIAVSILVTVLLTRQGTAAQFDHLMVDGHMIQPVRLQQALAYYYQQQHTWQGIASALDELLLATSDGVMRDMMGGMMGMHNNRIQLLDTTGQILADSHGMLTPLAAANGRTWPIQHDGQPVGLLVVEGMLMSATDTTDGLLVRSVTRAVLVAGLLAGGLGLVLAGLLVRQITYPLAGLRQASYRIAAGDLTVRVPLQSQDELGYLAATFNQMAQRLETQETLRRNLVADVAHELRTPLAAVQGTVEAMQDGVFAMNHDNLATIHEEVMLLNRLVEDLRTLANAEAGQLSLDKGAVDLGALAERQVLAFRYRAQEQGVALALHVGDGLPTIAGDEQRLGQVLSNLLDNALRHTPANGTVHLTVTERELGVRLTITDSGDGIAPQDLPHIFDRFYRVEPARTPVAGGSGLGLAIARQLVEAHGGRIAVQSPPVGRTTGTEFSIDLW